MVSGQAPQPDTQADCPYYDDFTGDGRHVRDPDDEPELRPARLGRGPERRRRAPTAASTRRACRRCSTSSTPRSVSWKGYAQDLGNPRHAARRVAQTPATQYCGAPYASPGATGSTAQPNPGSANADRPVRAQALPVPVVRVDPAVRRLQPAAHRQPVRPDQRPLPRPAERRDDARRSAGSRRTTAATPTTPSATATTSRAASPTRPPRTRRSTTPAACTRRTCSWSTSSPRSRRRRRSRTAA